MRAPLSRPRILVVDDNVENLDVLQGILKQDYQVLCTTQGKKAVELAQKKPIPDLILLDIMMPEMNGYQVLMALKKSEVTRHIPVIFVTAMAEIESETKGLRMGAADYITKPVNPLLVKARVYRHLQLKSARNNIQDLLDNTLTGVVSLMTDIVNMINPDALSNAKPVQKHMKLLTQKIGLQAIWQYELAAMFSYIGFAIVHSSGSERTRLQGYTSMEQYEVSSDHPKVAARLLKNISQLGPVGDIILKGHTTPLDKILSKDELNIFAREGIGEVNIIKGGAFLLRLSLEISQLIQQGHQHKKAYQIMSAQFKDSAPDLSQALLSISEQSRVIKPLHLAELMPGMELEEDLYTAQKALVMNAGTELTYASIERLQSFADGVGLILPVIVSYET